MHSLPHDWWEWGVTSSAEANVLLCGEAVGNGGIFYFILTTSLLTEDKKAQGSYFARDLKAGKWFFINRTP